VEEGDFVLQWRGLLLSVFNVAIERNVGTNFCIAASSFIFGCMLNKIPLATKLVRNGGFITILKVALGRVV